MATYSTGVTDIDGASIAHAHSRHTAAGLATAEPHMLLALPARNKSAPNFLFFVNST